MFTITRQIEIDAGHRVPYHDSKCRRLHGHRYKIIAHIQAETLVAADTRRSDAGMVVDFGFIKELMMSRIHDPFDHRMMLWEQDPKLHALRSTDNDLQPKDPLGIIVLPCIPTAEELAHYWGLLIITPLYKEGVHWLSRLEVHETPNSVACVDYTADFAVEVGVSGDLGPALIRLTTAAPGEWVDV